METVQSQATSNEGPEIINTDLLLSALRSGHTIRNISLVSDDNYEILITSGRISLVDLRFLLRLYDMNFIPSEIASELHLPLVPENPIGIENNDITSRFSGALWYDAIRNKSVTLAGVGGIGSYVGFLLSRLNIAMLRVYDPDKVEEGNLSGQMYTAEQIGQYKTHALYSNVVKFSKFSKCATLNEAFSDTNFIDSIAMCGFDNMVARKVFYNKWKGRSIKELFIDGRLAAEEFQVIAIQGDDERAMREYEENWLFTDEEAENEVCSYKQTSYMANMIASVMVNIFVNYIANKQTPAFPYEVPFLTTYKGSTMMFNVKS